MQLKASLEAYRLKLLLLSIRCKLLLALHHLGAKLYVIGASQCVHGLATYPYRRVVQLSMRRGIIVTTRQLPHS